MTSADSVIYLPKGISFFFDSLLKLCPSFLQGSPKKHISISPTTHRVLTSSSTLGRTQINVFQLKFFDCLPHILHTEYPHSIRMSEKILCCFIFSILQRRKINDAEVTTESRCLNPMPKIFLI